MAVQAGKLRDKLVIKTRLPASDGNAAAVTVREQWGQIRPLTGREMEVGAATGEERSVVIVFRENPRILKRNTDGSTFFIVDQDGVEYEILHVQHYRADRQEIYCRLINQ